MSSHINITFDEKKIEKQKLRSLRLCREKPLEEVFFLHNICLAEIQERLQSVLRSFDKILDLSGGGLPLDSGQDKVNTHIQVIDKAFLSFFENSPFRKPSISLLAGSPHNLPFPPMGFNLVIAALSLHCANHLPEIMKNIWQVLAPDGLFMAAFLGERSLYELRTALTLAESDISGGLTPRIIPFMDVRQVGDLLQKTGFVMPVTDMQSLTVYYTSPRALLQDLRRMGMTNPLSMRQKTLTRRAIIERMEELYVQEFSDSNGRIPARFDIIYASGWHPVEKVPV